ncbi:MAG: transcriptional repressor NrdR [Deltaproteobacteria bacterium]|nr:transcriptional repressor NrdR [Candidatus Anaeroferrophillacea bacterium]
MKCPYCGFLEDKVIDSRVAKDHSSIRRRRECLACGRRFTTFERLEIPLPMVVKRGDGRRETFMREKVEEGLKKACEKRPVGIDEIEKIINTVEQELSESGEKEIASSVIGEKVMALLKQLDEVAYIRFASVYRQFRDVKEFMAELEDLVSRDPYAGTGRTARHPDTGTGMTKDAGTADMNADDRTGVDVDSDAKPN